MIQSKITSSIQNRGPNTFFSLKIQNIFRLNLINHSFGSKIFNMRTCSFIFKNKVERKFGEGYLSRQDCGCGRRMFQYCLLAVGNLPSCVLLRKDIYLIGLKIRHTAQVICQRRLLKLVKREPKGKRSELFCPANPSLFKDLSPTFLCIDFLETPIPFSTFDLISKCIFCL